MFFTLLLLKSIPDAFEDIHNLSGPVNRAHVCLSYCKLQMSYVLYFAEVL